MLSSVPNTQKYLDLPLPLERHLLRIKHNHRKSGMADEEPDDCFTTHWTGPYDPRAMAYASENDLGYSISGQGIIAQAGPGVFTWSGGYGDDPVAMREANRASDDEYRKWHATDMELDTGNTIFDPSIESLSRWAKLSRGCKLRTCRKDRGWYRGVLDVLDRRVKELYAVLVKDPLKQPEEHRKRLLDKAWDAIFFGLVKSKEVEKMVLAETEEGWD